MNQDLMGRVFNLLIENKKFPNYQAERRIDIVKGAIANETKEKLAKLQRGNKGAKGATKVLKKASGDIKKPKLAQAKFDELDKKLIDLDKNIKTVSSNKALVKLNTEELNGYEYVRSVGEVTKKQYAEYFKFNDKKAQRHLSLFYKLKLVKQVGKGPRTKYAIM